MNDENLVAMSKGEDYLEVHPTTVDAHKRVGWAECAPKVKELTKAEKKAADKAAAEKAAADKDAADKDAADKDAGKSLA